MALRNPFRPRSYIITPIIELLGGWLSQHGYAEKRRKITFNSESIYFEGAVRSIWFMLDIHERQFNCLIGKSGDMLDVSQNIDVMSKVGNGTGSISNLRDELEVRSLVASATGWIKANEPNFYNTI